MIRTAFLLTLLTLLLVWVGSLIGGRSGMIVAFGIGLLLNFFNYWFSSKIVLAVYRAKPIGEGAHPWLVEDVRDLAGRAGLPMPKVAIIENAAPNAFATGRNPKNAVVAVTTGLLQTLDRRQVRAVIGHELGHVKNRDMLTMTLVAGAVSAVSLLAHFGFMFGGHRGSQDDDAPSPIVAILVMLLAPLMAMMIQMAISRSREYGADDSGAEISKDPAGLADGLEALHRAIPHRQPLSRTGATAHMMIANPFFGMRVGQLFSTHPDPARRIARLRAMAAGR
jgi:heat shock protein HtpX